MAIQKIVEEISDIGELYEGERFLRYVGYHLTVAQEQLDAGTMGHAGSSVDGVPHVEGRLEDIDDHGGFYDLLEKKLILHLNDGRRWDCVIESIGNTNARVIGRGKGFYMLA